MRLSIYLLSAVFSFGVFAQTEEIPSEPQSEEEQRLTNEGEEFVDPFERGAEEESIDVVDDEPFPVQSPAGQPIEQDLILEPEEPGQPIRQQEPAPVQRQVPRRRQAPQQRDDQGFILEPLPEEQAPFADPKAEPLAPEEQEEFNFPIIERRREPITQHVKEQANLEKETPIGSWNLGFGLGAGLNVNRRPAQVHFEINGGYRLWKNGELGGTIFGRFVTDKLVGFLAMYKGFWRLTNPPSRRMEITYGGGLGWTLRAPSDVFTEGRMTFRGQSSFLFYASPRFALEPSLALETFIFSLDQEGLHNLMSNGGPPTQLIALFGVRFEF